MTRAVEFKSFSIEAEMTGGSRRIVNDLSFSINEKERMAIVGESGSGKTMTAMAIFGLLPDNCHALGEVLYQSRNLLSQPEKELARMRGDEIVLMPQSGADFLNPSLKISYQFYESLRKKSVKEKDLYAKAAELLFQVGFPDPRNVLNKYPFQLSGGMAQRVTLAIGLSADAKIVVCDEPTRGIDDETSELFLDSLYEAFSESSIMIITHNIALASRCDNVLVMLDGELMEYGSKDLVLGSPSHPYTQSLIDALPENGFCTDAVDWGKYYPVDDGQGCVFARRCPRSDERCFMEKPHVSEKNNVLKRCFYAECNESVEKIPSQFLVGERGGVTSS